MSSLRNFLKPVAVREWVALLREHGLKEFVRQKGWKFIVAIFLFYLIRDTALYLVVPYLAAKGLFGC